MNLKRERGGGRGGGGVYPDWAEVNARSLRRGKRVTFASRIIVKQILKSIKERLIQNECALKMFLEALPNIYRNG